MNARWWFWVVISGLGSAGCGGGDDDREWLTLGTGPVECGTLTCTDDEICLETDLAPFSFDDSAPTHACGRAPDGCDASRLCDCGIEFYAGAAVQGCSILGERTLYLADVRCGAAACTEAEACLVETLDGTPSSDATLRCVPLPDGCVRSSNFCDADECSSRIAIAEGYERSSGCFAAEWAVGLYVRR